MAYIRGHISRVLISGDFIQGHMYGGLYPRYFYLREYTRGLYLVAYIRGTYIWVPIPGQISGGLIYGKLYLEDISGGLYLGLIYLSIGSLRQPLTKSL